MTTIIAGIRNGKVVFWNGSKFQAKRTVISTQSESTHSGYSGSVGLTIFHKEFEVAKRKANSMNVRTVTLGYLPAIY